jgi:hypothetical protein
VAPRHTPPFSPDALVEEEDTFLVLSADSGVGEVTEHPIRLMTAIWEAQPETPGSVVVRHARHGRPRRLLAVVHDLQQEPTWREEWVREALDGVLREAEARGVRRLAVPLLGCVHGGLGRERFISLLGQALQRASVRVLESIWIVTAASEVREVEGLLGAWVP